MQSITRSPCLTTKLQVGVAHYPLANQSEFARKKRFRKTAAPRTRTGQQLNGLQVEVVTRQANRR